MLLKGWIFAAIKELSYTNNESEPLSLCSVIQGLWRMNLNFYSLSKFSSGRTNNIVEGSGGLLAAQPPWQLCILPPAQERVCQWYLLALLGKHRPIRDAGVRKLGRTIPTAVHIGRVCIFCSLYANSDRRCKKRQLDVVTCLTELEPL